MSQRQLISYIALGAPATRRPAQGNEPYLRPEIGFTPRWYYDRLGVDFGEKWHLNPEYRREAVAAMAREVRTRFSTNLIGPLQTPEQPSDLLTGTFGTCFVASLFGVGIIYGRDSWPWSEHRHLSDEEADSLRPPALDNSPTFQALMRQLDWIERRQGSIVGYLNWQGVLNNAYRLRGESIFLDLVTQPERAHHVFSCVKQTMVEAASRIFERQRQSGFEIDFFTVSNCLVNMISPAQYEEFLWPHDRELAEVFGLLGIHNCAWNADPYVDYYARLPNIGYVDMGLESDLRRARQLFSAARRAVMYPPVALKDKPVSEIAVDLERIATEYGPCDVVFADIESDTPDSRVREILTICEDLSQRCTARLSNSE